MTESGADVVAQWRIRIDQELRRVAELDTRLPPKLRETIFYSLTGEGKRLRGLLLMASFDATAGNDGRDASALAAAVEIVHAYSLVHDDLPCMDNDSMRRGRATAHLAFDVPTATIAGVAMVPLAVRQVLRGARRLHVSAETTRCLVRVLMEASGAQGMVGGQLSDLEGEGRAMSLSQLEHMHRAKTGALIRASFALGALAASDGDFAATPVQALTEAGEALGLAFQIADDVLDATSSSETLGKTAGLDAVLDKSTYASLMGIDAARTRGDALVAEAMKHLTVSGVRTPLLEQLAHFVAARRS